MQSNTERTRLPSIDELQPLGWVIDESFDPATLGSVHALRIPPVWVDNIRSLGDADSTPPIVGLYAVLRAAVPDAFYAFPNSFAGEPDKRPTYWLLSFSNSLITINGLWDIIKVWMRENYDLSVVRSVAQQMESVLEQMEWEPIDLGASPEILQIVLPHLVARHLVRRGFQLGLSDGSGSPQYWQLVTALSSRTAESAAVLVTWPPVSYQSTAQYSYYLRFQVVPPEGKTPMLLLLKAGIRRYMMRPLATQNGGSVRIALPYKQRSSVYFAVQEMPWLTGRQQSAIERETTLIPLSLVRYSNLSWQGKINQVFSSLVSSQVLPEPLEFLTNPSEFRTQLLITYRTKFGSYSVKAGLEAADRYEVYERLTQALPHNIIPAPPIQKIEVAHLKKKRFSKSATSGGIGEIKGSYRLRLSTNSPDVFSQALQEFLCGDTVKGNLDNQGDGKFIFTNRLGDCYLLEIDATPLPFKHSATLALGNSTSGSDISAATQQRASMIARELRNAPPAPKECRGVLIEMLNYREMKGKQRLLNPKLSVRWGYARSSWASQFFTPLQATSDTPEWEQLAPGERSRCQNALLDLLRQLSFPLGLPFYTGFYQTNLPNQIDIYGIYIIRLNARRKGESKVILPVVVRIPASDSCSELLVCLPGEAGPQWMSYHDALLQLASIDEGGMPSYEAEQIQNFVECVFRDLDMAEPALLLLSEQNLKKFLPQLVQLPATSPQAEDNPWLLGKILPVQQPKNLRVARLRSSSEGLVGDVCPLSQFNRYSGIYHNPSLSDAFFSVGKSPRSAQRPTNARQRSRVTKAGWNQSALEISWLCLQPDDVLQEWTLVVHRLRESSPFISSESEIVTAFPQPIHAAKQLSDYISRLEVENEVSEDENTLELEEAEETDEPEFVQLSLF